jgi:hypothetical protein
LNLVEELDSSLVEEPDCVFTCRSSLSFVASSLLEFTQNEYMYTFIAFPDVGVHPMHGDGLIRKVIHARYR